MKFNIKSRIYFTLALPICFFSIICCTSDNQSVKLQQYYAEGEILYVQHCSNCHQKDGAGLGLLYPQINTSDYLDNHLTDIICIIKNGAIGKMVVNGKEFNHAMPGFPLLTDLEIAEITSYIYNSWGRQHGIVDANEVNRTLSTCKN